MISRVQIQTPRGLRHPDEMDAGDEVLSRDAASGRLICNRLETRPQWVDAGEFARWWNGKPPAFRFLRINGHFVFSRSQSIWCNGFITHVAHLKIGDVLYTERNGFVRVHSIEDDLPRDGWWRCDVDGDHSYILDGVLVHNASRFWVGGTGTWDSSTTTHWAASSNGAGGQSVPGSADTVTFDGSSGGGTVTLNFGGTITVQSVAMGAFTGTWDNSINNNNMTLSAGSSAFNGSGSGARTIKLGTATYTLTNNACIWNFGTSTNLTYTGSSASISFTGTSGARQIQSSTAGLSHGNVSVAASSGAGLFRVNGQSVANITLASLGISAPNFVEFPSGAAATISAAVNWAGSPTAQIGIAGFSTGTSATINLAASSALNWCSIRDCTFTGSPGTANCFDLGNNSGVTINPPPVYPRPGLQAIEQGLVR